MYEQQREKQQVTAYLLYNIVDILLNGTQLIKNQVFKLIGFDSLSDNIQRHLVIAADFGDTRPVISVIPVHFFAV